MRPFFASNVSKPPHSSRAPGIGPSGPNSPTDVWRVTKRHFFVDIVPKTANGLK